MGSLAPRHVARLPHARSHRMDTSLTIAVLVPLFGLGYLTARDSLGVRRAAADARGSILLDDGGVLEFVALESLCGLPQVDGQWDLTTSGNALALWALDVRRTGPQMKPGRLVVNSYEFTEVLGRPGLRYADISIGASGGEKAEMRLSYLFTISVRVRNARTGETTMQHVPWVTRVGTVTRLNIRAIEFR